jgi:hypothetical protein
LLLFCAVAPRDIFLRLKSLALLPGQLLENHAAASALRVFFEDSDKARL